MDENETDMIHVNQATWDRLLRILLAAALFGLGASGWVSEDLGAVLRVASLLPLVTGALGWCPIYDLLGMSTVRAAGRGGHRGTDRLGPVSSAAPSGPHPRPASPPPPRRWAGRAALRRFPWGRGG